MMYKKTIFFDMDGVIADFNSKCIELIGCTLDDFKTSKEGWDALGAHKLEMYADLALMSDAKELVYSCHVLADFYNYRTGILTAIPKIGRVPLARQHKEQWIEKHFPRFSSNFNIGPWAEDKNKHCCPGDILIDDMQRNISQWQEAGGIGILHVSAEQTIKQLREYLESQVILA